MGNEYGTNLLDTELSHVSARYELYCSSFSSVINETQKEEDSKEESE